MNDNDNDKLISGCEVCTRLDICPSTLYQLRFRKDLNFPKGIKVGSNKVMFKMTDIEN